MRVFIYLVFLSLFHRTYDNLFKTTQAVINRKLHLNVF